MSERYRQFQLRIGALSSLCTNSSYWCAGGMYILSVASRRVRGRLKNFIRYSWAVAL